MIPSSHPLYHQLLPQLSIDPIVKRYHELFAVYDWPSSPPASPHPGRPGNDVTVYIKAFMLKLTEGLEYCTTLRRYLVEHPLVVVVLGFRVHLDCTAVYGFDVEKTVPTVQWLRTWQKTLPLEILHGLFTGTIKTLTQEIPGLDEHVAIDVKHIYAWVRENNPRESIAHRYDPERRPNGDPDCRLGVKKSHNQTDAQGKHTEKKEYVWGYGSGVAATTVGGYGDMVLGEITRPFNTSDVHYFDPLFDQACDHLGQAPQRVTADAAYDAWYVYERVMERGGKALIPLNTHGHEMAERDSSGIPYCERGDLMHPTFPFRHTNGYRAVRCQCPLLLPVPTGETCAHEQFTKGKGCVKDVNWEAGGLERVLLNRRSPTYTVGYAQRTCVERINSQAKSLGIERPRVRNIESVKRLNTITYLLINGKVIQRAHSINHNLLHRVS